MEVTPPLKTYAEQKAMKLPKYYDRIQEIEVIGDAIEANLKATDRDGAIRELVTNLAAAGALPDTAVDEVVSALIKREQNGSTGFGKGVAVPHTKHPKVKKMAGTIGRSEAGIDF